MKSITYLREVSQRCIDELNAIGIYPNITPDNITVNNRLKRVWGQCWTHWGLNRTTWWFEIEISPKLMEDDVSEEALRNTVLHELLHACDECVNCHHGGKWAEYAELVSDCYGVKIQRCTSSAEKNIADDRNEYKWKCSACGKIFTKKGYRAPKWYMHPQGFTHKGCPCGKGYVMSAYYGYKLI